MISVIVSVRVLILAQFIGTTVLYSKDYLSVDAATAVDIADSRLNKTLLLATFNIK